jgi:hypothetical protein
MMVAFGASFGLTIMSRIAEMHSRILVVLAPEALPILPLTLLLVVVFAVLPRGFVEKIISRKK